MQEKYDTIGINYNTTRKVDPYLFTRMYTLLNPTTHGMYLDIGCGTGNYTSAFAEKGYNFIGIDPSEKMLNVAKAKNKNVIWKFGKAEQIDLPNDSIDGCIASLTLHHWYNLDQGFSELKRVLKKEGKIIVLTATPNQMKGYWLTHYFPKMLADSIKQMPSFKQITSCLQKNNLELEVTEKYDIRPDLQDLFLYSGKHNPSLYLNSQVRNGISSFSSLANTKEVKIGLSTLKDDIGSGRVNDIISKYKNTDGDYLFLVIKKSLK